MARERAQALIVSANLSSSGATRGQARRGAPTPASTPLKGEVVIRRSEPLTGMRSRPSAPAEGNLSNSGEGDRLLERFLTKGERRHVDSDTYST